MDDASRIFDNRKALRHEYCRVLYKRAVLFRKMGNVEDAVSTTDECSKLFRTLHVGSSFDDVNDESIDELVAFWSR